MRRITSLTLVLGSLFELVTSLVLYVLPAGRVAYWSEYRLFGLSKTQWGNLHITMGFLLIAMAILHVYYNWRPLVAYLKSKTKTFRLFTASFNIAALICAFVAVGTLYNLPPMSIIVQVGEHFKERANQKHGEPPYGHAELSSLSMFCRRVDLDLTMAQSLLREAKIDFDGPQETIGDIATRNGMTPQAVYDAIRAAGATAEDGMPGFPSEPSPGFGMQTISAICDTYGLERPTVKARLLEAGFDVKPDDTVKSLAERNGANPMKIFELLQDIARK